MPPFPFRLKSLCAGIVRSTWPWLLMVAASLPGLGGAAPKAPPQPRQILVKLREPLARALEAEWSGPAKPLLARGLQNSQTRAFLADHRVSSLRPLYPGLLEMRRKTGWSDAQIAEHIRQAYPVRTRHLGRPHPTPEVSRVYLIDIDAGSSEPPAALLARMKADPNVEYAEMNHVVSTYAQPNDPFLSSSGTWGQPYQDLWGLQVMHAPAAWDTSTGSGMVVAVIDTGVDYRHPDLAVNMWTNPQETAGNGVDDDGNGYVDDVLGMDFIGADASAPVIGNDPLDRHGHGTHAAGIIAAAGNNGLGVIGVAWNAKIMAIKGLDDSGYGLDTSLAPAVLYAANNGADVINASWGGPGSSQTIEEAIQYAYSVGVVFVAAAGNAGQDAWGFYPANAPEAITVAAVAPPDGTGWPSWSNFGTKIDVAAPGVDILSLRASGSTLGQVVADNYMLLSGTSMAAPHVAGLAALILAQRPGFPIESLRQTIRATASNTYGTWYPTLGAGLPDAQAALALTGALQAHFTAPAGRSRIAGPVQLRGTVQGTGFDHYSLEYGAGLNPTTWLPIQNSSLPVENGLLGTFDPSQLPDGTYTLRLTAFDAQARAFQDRVDVDVAYLAISSPPKPTLPIFALQMKPGAQVQITGQAGGPSFQSYRIEWAEGMDPGSGWSSAGMTLTSGGTAPVAGGQLGTWDTTGITKAAYYTIRLSADNAGFTSTATTLVYLEPDLLSQGWPKALSQSSLLYRGLVPVKSVAGGTTLALVTPSTVFSPTTTFFRYTPDGQVLNTVSLVGGGSDSGPSVGDVLGTGDEDVLFAAFENKLTSFRRDNSYLMLQPRTSESAINYWSGNPPLARLEGPNTLPDIVALGSNTATGTGSLYAWRGDGSLAYSNLASGIPDLNFGVLANPTGVPRVLVGDVNGDGFEEFVVVEGPSTSTYTLGLYALDGARIPWTVPTFNGYPTALVLADLDHNGRLETVMVDLYRTIHVFQPDGSERPGWPKTLDPDWQEGAVAVGDLAHTGQEQIAVPAGFHLYLFNADGSSYSSAWPVPVPMNLCGSTALADVDGDGIQEILVVQPNLLWLPNPAAMATAPLGVAGDSGRPTSRLQVEGTEGALRRAKISTEVGGAGFEGSTYYESYLVAYRPDGTVSRSWNLLGASGNQPSSIGVITVGDFDGDGLTDIGVTYPTIEGGDISGWLIQGVATVLSTGMPYRPDVNDWPTTNRDAWNSAVLNRIKVVPPGPALSGISPASAPSGAQVVLTGTGLRFASSVAFNGQPATFTVDSDTSISTTVPSGGASGTVVARTPGGVASIAFVEVPSVVVTVTPKAATLLAGGQVALAAAVTGTQDTAVTWAIESGGGSLSASEGQTVTFTAPAQPGTAHIRATSHADATKTDAVTVTVVSRDLNGDGSVDVLDLALLARAYNATSASSNWNPAADLDGDGTVGTNDLSLFLAGM